jgi:hypothetical protein
LRAIGAAEIPEGVALPVHARVEGEDDGVALVAIVADGLLQRLPALQVRARLQGVMRGIAGLCGRLPHSSEPPQQKCCDAK